MLPLTFLLIGAVIGAWTAHKREGNRLDIAQYAAGYGIAFGLVGVAVTMMLSAVLS